MIQRKKRQKNPRKPMSNLQDKILTPSSAYEVREAYIKLRTSLLYSVVDKQDESSLVFSVTSPNMEEGKSISASNVAVCFAMLGKKTLLLDLDLRRPKLCQLWNLDMHHGFTNILTQIESFKVHTINEIPLSIITSGDIPPNPTELLSSKKYEAVIDILKKEFEIIILDCPPVNVVADAQIISRVADGMILVVKSGTTKSRDLRIAEQTLRKTGIKILGIVNNGLNPKLSENIYQYYGDYHLQSSDSGRHLF